MPLLSSACGAWGSGTSAPGGRRAGSSQVSQAPRQGPRSTESRPAPPEARLHAGRASCQAGEEDRREQLEPPGCHRQPRLGSNPGSVSCVSSSVQRGQQAPSCLACEGVPRTVAIADKC